MYSYIWDTETGGLILNSSPLTFSKEPRPVYYKELDILGFDQYWNYEKNDSYPYMWAEANNYFYRGRLVAKTKGGTIYSAPEIIIEDDPEPNGEQLRFVDIPEMIEKNRDLVEKLASNTIKKIYNTYLEYKDKIDVFYVAFSGGKDSVVTLDLVQRSLPHNKFKVLFGDTGMEFPDTYELVRKIKKYCDEFDIEFLQSKCDFDPLYTWREFGPPAQTIRWCCSVHKTAPQIIFLRDYTGNPHFKGMAFTGIRGDESASRSEYNDVNLGEKIKGQYSCHPIIEWNSVELFLYIYERNLLLNDAYLKGNGRAGCLVCPLATSKNIFFKEQAYSTKISEYKTTTDFNNIILETTSKELSDQSAIEEFMNIGGWKARRSGRELSFAREKESEYFEKGVLTIQSENKGGNWRQWIKTIGDVIFLENGNVDIYFKGKVYHVDIDETSDKVTATTLIESNTQKDIYFMSALKIIFRKAAYCIGCRVCEANCPHGYIKMVDGSIIIDEKCVKCQKCHDVFHGCLLANSLRLPKGEKKMGSIDRYGNMGIEYEWVKEYLEKEDDFWTYPHGLGSNMIKNLKCFLNDSGITIKGKFSEFGGIIKNMGIENGKSWALMLCNLAYTSEFNWWIKNIDFSVSYTPDSIYSMLDDSMSKNSRNHIVSAYKNILISIPQLGTEIGLGKCDYEVKSGRRIWKNVVRIPWTQADPLIILYSLFKFAEVCGDYYQFTLSRLLNHEIDSDGVSPTEMFGLDRDQMEKILNGLSVNYPDFINASFTLDLDNITLNSVKTSQDVLQIL